MKQEGYLHGRYMGPTNEKFVNSEEYRMSYSQDGDKITVWSAPGDKQEYATLAEFRDDWDLNNVAERYRANNPDLDEAGGG